MNIKSFLTVILILYCIAGLAFHADADDKTDFTVKDVEYLKGTDFVQLYFKIGKMIPIPDVFYPDKNDTKRIIMRISNVAFQLGKNQLAFDSAVIDSMKIDSSGAYTDVEILLKSQVNYRVFTNRKGLYIEFPIENQGPPTSRVIVANDSKPVTTTPTKASVPVAPVSQPTTTTTKVPPKETPTTPEPSELAYIKDIILTQKDASAVKFDIILSRAVDFAVIPIPNDPVRLAIDLKESRGGRIQKSVDQLNVKRIRGSFNTASVYRVVFDLHYLNNYKVSPKNGERNVLEVAFFNKDNKESDVPTKNATNDLTAATVNPPQTEEPTTTNEEDAAKAIEARVLQEQNVAATPTENTENKTDTANTTTPNPTPTPQVQPQPVAASPVIEAGDKDESETEIIISQTESGIELSDPSPHDPVSRIEDKNAITAEPVQNKITSQDGTIAVTTPKSETGKPVSEDFFGEEKSEIAQETTSADHEVTGNTEAPTQISWLNQTIASGKRKYTGTAMGFNFHNADLKDVIKIIAKISGLNIIMDPGIAGRVTAQLKDVPWDQALDLFLRINNLSMVQEGNILRIGTVANLAAEAQQKQILTQAKDASEELEVFTKTLSFAKVTEASGILRDQLSPRGKLLQDPRTNTLIISDIPDKITEMKKLIKVLDTANPQVSIEARIVETNANFIESFGIQWGYNFIADATHGNQTTLKFPNSVTVAGNQFTSDSSPLVGPLGGYAVNLPANGATSGTVFTLGNVANTLRLDMALSAMQTSGEGRIISAPKTTTQNNQEASIMQGKQIPVQTIQNNTITVVYKPAALELKVTPQITADGTVVTKLEIMNNSADFGNLVNGIPPITTQSITTTVMVPDGGTIVIGGMYKVEKTSTKAGVPFFSKIPILGNLFKNSARRNEQKELLVFITPRIIK